MTSIALYILIGTAIIIGAVAMLPRFARRFGRRLKPGDRIRLAGGYDAAPDWLAGAPHIDGRVISFVAESGSDDGVVVQLERPVTARELTSDYIVLRLRYADARWTRKGVVHVELLSRPWSAEQGHTSSPERWIESHATYETLSL